MAKNSWREDSGDQSSQPKKKAPSKPFQFGTITRVVSILVLAVAILYSVAWMLGNRQLKKTSWFNYSYATAEANASGWSGNVFLPESARQLDGLFGQDTSNVFPTNFDSSDKPLGPESNVALFYVHGQLHIDSNDQVHLLKNQKDLFDNRSASPVETNQQNWESLESILTNISTKKIGTQHRIVVLDICQFDHRLARQLYDKKLPERIRDLLDQLVSEKVENCEQLWVMMSFGNESVGWHAPELHSTVFGYFVAQGLRGWAAEKREDNTIQLDQLFQFVKSAVSTWVRDYRGSTQIPVLMSTLTKDQEEAIQSAADVQVIYNDKELVQPAPAQGHVQSNVVKLDNLWDKYQTRLPQLTSLPHQKAMLEARLLRMEQLSFSQNEPAFQSLLLETQSIVDSLEKLKRFKTREEDQFKLLSIKDKVANNLVTVTSTDHDNFAMFVQLNAPQSTATSPDATEKEAEEKSKEEDKKKLIKIVESLDSLTTEQRVAIAWDYLNSNENSPIDQAAFEQCVRFINQGVSGNTIQSVEAQFLNLLKTNMVWGTDPDSLAKQQMLLQKIIQCRDTSESISQASAVIGYSRSDHARIWNHFQGRFQQLETTRRSVEDRFLAGDMTNATAIFSGTDNQTLITQFETFSDQFHQTLSALRMAREVFDISPQIRNVLARKSLFQSHSPVFAEQFLKQLVDAEKAAAKVIDLIGNDTIPAFNTLITKEQTVLNTSLEGLRSSTESQWIQPIIDATQDATDGTLVFDALNILRSTIPEWVGNNETGGREKIRAKVNDWIIKYQRPKLFDKWDNFLTAVREPDSPVTASTLFDVASSDFDSIVKSSTFENLSPTYLKRPTGNGWPDLPLPTTKSSQQFTESVALSDIDKINTERNRLFEIDSDLRLLRSSLGYTQSSLDVGGRLALLDRLTMDHAKFERAIQDLWGAGDVGAATTSPPFVQYANAYQEQLDVRVKQLENFTVPTPSDEREWPQVYEKGTKSFRDLFTQRLAAVNKFWDELRDQKVTWLNDDDQPLEKEFMAGTSVGLVAKLNAPIDWKQMDSKTEDVVGQKTMSCNDQSDRQILNNRFEFAKSLASSQLNRKSNELVVEFNWRGHRFVGRHSITRIEPEKPKIIVATSALERTPTKSGIVVQNSDDIFADIMFVLDCSGSMGKKVKGKQREGSDEETTGTRLEFSKNALTATLSYLQKEKRCRFGFAAFAHRARFVTKKSEDGNMRYVPDSQRDGRYKFISSDSNVHPFNDFQTIFRFEDNNDSPVSSKFHVETLVRIIEEADKAPEDRVLVPNGVTPLYLSIVTAGGELALSDNQQKILVVLTDGRDLQMPDSKALPDNVDEGTRTTLDDVSTFLGANPKVKLYVIHVGSADEADDRSSQPEPKFKGLADKYENFDFVTVNDNDSQAISNEILNAIGRNRYSIHESQADGNQLDELRIGDQRPDIPNGQYVVKTNVKENPDQMLIELGGGESVFLLNSKDGLRLNNKKHNQLKFLEFNNTPQKANLSLGDLIYDVGLLAPKADIRSSGIRIGLVKNTFESFAFRPQRIWVEIKDNNGPWKTNLLQYFYEPGEDPIASFQLAPEIRPRLTNVDMRVWIVPNPHDGGATLDKSQNIRWPGGKAFKLRPGINDEFEGVEFSCNLKKESDTVFSVTIEGDGTGRPYLIDCPVATKTARRITFANDTQTTDQFEFEIPEGEQAEFTLYIQPDSTMPQDKVRLEGQIQHGQGIDPIFGDEAQWVEFKNIDLSK